MPVGRLEMLVSRLPVLSRLTDRLDRLRLERDHPPAEPAPMLGETAHAVRSEGLTYLSPEHLLRLETTARQVVRDGVEGDLVEFGIALGGSAIVLAQIAARAGREFHGFDLFGMIPPPSSSKDDQKSVDRYAVIASGQSVGINGGTYYGYRSNLYDDVCAAFERYAVAVDGKSVNLHKGLFEETIPNFQRQAIAFAHIDCDWYDPVLLCLDGIADRIAQGGVILLDDYNAYGGCRTATHEFLARRHDFDFEGGSNPILRKISPPSG